MRRLETAAWLLIAGIGFLTAILVALTLAYRRSNALGRRQIKWIVYGSYVAILPSVVSFAAYSLGIRPEWTNVLAAIAFIGVVASPLSVLVAMASCDFLDIDRLFSATLTYSMLLIVGLAIVLGVMPTGARAASDALGLDPASGHLLFSLGVAAILVPAQRLVRPRIIWTVIGNTTNLAARLQSVTRELEAAVAVDDRTFRRAGRACTDFLHHGNLAIRGRTQPESVYTLPLRHE